MTFNVPSVPASILVTQTFYDKTLKRIENLQKSIKDNDSANSSNDREQLAFFTSLLARFKVVPNTPSNYEVVSVGTCISLTDFITLETISIVVLSYTDDNPRIGDATVGEYSAVSYFSGIVYPFMSKSIGTEALITFPDGRSSILRLTGIKKVDESCAHLLN